MKSLTSNMNVKMPYLLVLGGRSVDDLTANGNLLFRGVNTWLSVNKLVLNKSNTDATFFGTKWSKVVKPPYSTTHVFELLKRLNSIRYGFRVISRYLNNMSMKILYHANFESILKYGIMFWGRNRFIQKNFVVQKRAVRLLK
ncbi:unnamed protein product [Acanthoscelides obtectus]|uniref:Uncharacterized protein n=1 Tax=Acanthoscelides obtectus TaxID=200917 RepID=A0A9P0LLB8_ACAOB|nr:unnamed protein product [Acanthoscelides obtectus]CAK1671048.1 hypothetical protein AOBTE_LOCUS28016 [Acanthoscelides obtectus]